MNLLSRYSGMVGGLARPDTVGTSSDFIVTPWKTASINSCKNLSTIQRLDQELWTFWPIILVSSVVWPDKKLGESSSDIFLTLWKTASANSCKNFSMIQRSDQELWTCWAGTLVGSVVWPDQTSLASSSDFIVTPRKTASTNSCKNLSTMIST